MFSMTAGREITEAEMEKVSKVAKELEGKFSIEGLTKQGDINKVVKKAGDAFAKRVGREAGCMISTHGLTFTFDNMRLNQPRN